MARLARLSCSPPPATGLTMADASSSAAPPGSSLRRSCQGPPCARSSGRPDGVSRRLRLAFALVALAAGLVNLALLLRLRTRHDLEAPFAETLLATLGVSWSFVAAGLVAWARRPGNRTGALMVAAGLAFSLNGLALIHTAPAFALWYLVASLPAATLGHLLAVFPDGRATTRLQRVFLVANYATTAPLALVQLLLVDAAALGCARCPPALLGLGGHHGRGMSCPVSSRPVSSRPVSSRPVSSRGLLVSVEERLEGAVLGGVVGGVVLPAAPDDVRPGAGEDADSVGVVVAPGAGSPVEISGPGVGVAGVASEVAQRLAQLLVGAPPEGDR